VYQSFYPYLWLVCFSSIYIVVFILLVELVLELEMCFFCRILCFCTFRFVGFKNYAAYILMISVTFTWTQLQNYNYVGLVF